MIKEIWIENYRSIAKGELHDLKKINVLIGPNNSGKSSILEVIYLMDTHKDLLTQIPRIIEISRSSKIHTLKQQQKHDSNKLAELAAEANKEIYVNYEKDKIPRVCCNVKYKFDNIFFARLRYSTSKSQYLASKEPWENYGHLVAIGDDFFYEEKHIGHKKIKTQLPLFSIPQTQGEIITDYKKIIQINKELQKPFPKTLLLRTSVLLSDTIDEFLYKNLRGAEDIKRIEDVFFKTFKRIGGKTPFRIDFVENIRIHFYGGSSIMLKDLGLGAQIFLRTLMAVVGLKFQVLLFEEPENYTNPATYEKLLEALLLCLKQTELKQIFITTHNMNIIDKLTILIEENFPEFLPELKILRTRIDKEGTLKVISYTHDEYVNIRNSNIEKDFTEEYE